MSVRAKGKLLLESTLLQVTAGRRYGLVGPNGKGKSTLLRLIARRQVPVPDGLDVLLVEQVGNPEGLCACLWHAKSLLYTLDVLLSEQCRSLRISATCQLSLQESCAFLLSTHLPMLHSEGMHSTGLCCMQTQAHSQL